MKRTLRNPGNSSTVGDVHDVFFEYDVSNVGRKRPRTKEEGYYESESEEDEDQILNKEKKEGQSEDMFSDTSEDEKRTLPNDEAQKRRDFIENGDAERLAHKGLRNKEVLNDDSDDEDDNGKYSKLRYEDIEGQEDTNQANDLDADEEGSEISVPSSPKRMSFNLKEDMEEGDFDENGNFIRKNYDPESQYDAWLNGSVSNKKSIAAAREAEQKRKEMENRRRNQELEEFSKLPFSTVPEALSFFIARMERDESILEFLQRQSGNKKSYKKKKNNTAEGISPERKSADAFRKKLIELITAGLTFLEDKIGKEDIYSETRESLQRIYQKLTSNSWSSPVSYDDSNSSQYNFKWEFDDKTYGPYTASQIQAWSNEGYFTDAKHAAFIQLANMDEWMYPNNICFCDVVSLKK
ncbi:U5 snRNP subunit Snu40 [Schizosaccharomyces pombe]|uniref:LIN1-like protein n=1 Tax=Schizosaccharomyces pombe (strain 972 / ATCC 24843) TaxID=284812 RepID=LIN1_SCHPO|nr:GYF domain-containing protein [Schizosaccharomyces pombe]O94693.1 RecName: Full=LIN1-like protein [Schizosaccharomyces pombe 972h-]CAB36871.1 GYF domain protein [Schizosaccharomyces pombe]|eukprot:NP_595641.1 GYF domain-containing protein [Schizosaccharomyces pombe]